MARLYDGPAACQWVRARRAKGRITSTFCDMTDTQAPVSAEALPQVGTLLPHEAVAAMLAMSAGQWVSAGGAGPDGNASDGVLAAGVLLAEMLSGTAAQGHGASVDTRFRSLPDDWARNLDEPLREHVHRALHQDPAQRFADIARFRDALKAWAGTPASRTLEALMGRMRQNHDFPVLGAALERVLAVASSDEHSLDDLSREVLGDVALTQQLLRLVNSAHYAQAARGAVTTVSRAVSLVGFNGVRDLALKQKRLEHMPHARQAARLKVDYVRALMAGLVAGELCVAPLWREEAQLGGMFQNFGRVLAQLHFPEEAALIERAVAEGRHGGREEAAVIQVLGLSHEDFGVGVARAWGLPADLLYCMRSPFGAPPLQRPARQREYLRWVAVAANRVVAALIERSDAPLHARLEGVSERYARVLGLKSGEFLAHVAHVQDRLQPLLALAGTEQASKFHQWAARKGAATTNGSAQASEHARLERQHAALKALAHSVLASPPERPLGELLGSTLAGLRQALQARCAVLCLRDPATGMFNARYGAGEGAAALLPLLRFDPATVGGVLSSVCVQGVPALVADTSVPAARERLPEALLEAVAPGAMWLKPLVHRGGTFGLLYADAEQPGGLQLDHRSREQIKALAEALLEQFRQRQARGEGAGSGARRGQAG